MIYVFQIFCCDFTDELTREDFCPSLKNIAYCQNVSGHSRVLLLGRNWNSPDDICEISHFLIFFAYALLITSPLSCCTGHGLSATEQYLLPKSVLR